MTIWAVVPVKPLRFGKSRLAQVLSEDARLALNQCLMSNTLTTLNTIPGIEHTLVISRDPQALTLARNHGARTVLENGTPHLNVALEKAMKVLQEFSISGALIIPSDLPLIKAEDVQRLVDLAQEPPVVGIVPDRHHDGTNGLLICPVGLMPFSFGPGSFQRHCELARASGARVEILELESMALDIDLPEDMLLVKDALNCGFSFES